MPNPDLAGMPNGWDDPAWNSGPYRNLYQPRFPRIEQAIAEHQAQQQALQQHAAQTAPANYLDRVQQAAMAGEPMPNLAELPGFQPNMPFVQPSDG